MHIIISHTKYKTSISVGGFLNSSNSRIPDIHLWLYLVCHPQDLQGPHLEAPFYISTRATASQSVGVYYEGSTEDGKQPRSAKRVARSQLISSERNSECPYTLCAGYGAGRTDWLRFSAAQRVLLLFFFSLRLLMLCQTRRQLHSGVESILMKVISLRTLGVRAMDDDTNKNKRRDRYSIKRSPDGEAARSQPTRQLITLLN